MRNSRSLPYVFISFLLMHIFFSPLSIGLFVLGLLLTIVHQLSQVFALRSQQIADDQAVVKSQPFVSVHIPICSEPPELVCETILSAFRQDYDQFEIIVLDNNTKNTDLWEPVQKYCKSLPGVKFVHHENVEGFKAGALNICRQLTDPKAEYIFTVDADYQLVEGCLSEAVRLAETYQTDLLQFPQAYWNSDVKTEGLSAEYQHYFNLFSGGSNSDAAVLGTGTLSLIRRSALDKIGGWPSNSITEDAELGTRFQTAGFKSHYVDKCVGRGIMPVELNGIRKQRLRWIFGNFQTLIGYLKTNRSKALKKESLLQLTAWINFSGLAIPLLLAESLMLLAFPQQASSAVMALATGGLVVYLLLKLMVFTKSYRQDPPRSFSAFFTHLAFYGESAFGWWDALAGLKKPFIRTNKFSEENDLRFLPLGPAAILTFCGWIWMTGAHSWLGIVLLSLAVLFAGASVFLFTQINHSQKLLRMKEYQL